MLIEPDKTTLTTNNAFTFLSPDDFIERIRGILLGDTHSRDNLCFKFTFYQGGAIQDIPPEDHGRLMYSPEDLAEIKTRYTQMQEHLESWINQDFTPLELILIRTRAEQGVSLAYKTPSGRMFKTRYIRAGEAKDLISDDFLHDLKHIPTRLH